MVGRYEISDNGWAQIEDIVAPPQTMGRPRRFDKPKYRQRNEIERSFG